MNTAPPSTSQAPAWPAPAADEAEAVDEPPELRLHQASPQRFQRTAIRRPNAQSSLLTKAIMGQSDDDVHETPSSMLANTQRRRSMASNISVASTADLTSDTGLTSPCRTNTPSPPIPEIRALRLACEAPDAKAVPLVGPADAPDACRDRPRRRCIQFACAAKPVHQDQPAPRPTLTVPPPCAQETSHRPGIRFACSTCPAPSQSASAEQPEDSAAAARLSPLSKPGSPSMSRKPPVPAAAANVSPRPSPIRRLSSKTTLSRPKFLRATSKDLSKEASQFHEFASGMAREDDWIRQGDATATTKLTINDTLTKENRIRRLGVEAEEEAALEDEEAEAAMDDDEEVDEFDGDDDDEEDEDEEDSDGYYTDEETGFAESDDDEEEEDENMILWTPSHVATAHRNSDMIPARRPSLNELQSDSSAATNASIRRVKAKRVKPQSDTPDLPDSTDFVCGTLDEDRPLEEAYLSCLAARRNGRLRVIPQDIDPSFPASDPDDDDEEDIYNPVAHDSDADVWVHGEMEDLHHGQDRARRRRRSELALPRQCRSPPPKRHHSPAPKAGARSPRPLFSRHSLRRARSPAPKPLSTPAGSPRHAAVQVHFQLAGRPAQHDAHQISPPPGASLPAHAQGAARQEPPRLGRARARRHRHRQGPGKEAPVAQGKVLPKVLQLSAPRPDPGAQAAAGSRGGAHEGAGPPDGGEEGPRQLRALGLRHTWTTGAMVRPRFSRSGALFFCFVLASPVT